jgi:Zn-finger nucleic acid-binding protein
VVKIETPQAHEAAVVHCAGCGGSREEGNRACSFCGSDFTIHELDLNTVCPGCLARVSDRARYCHHCATALSVEAVAGEETSQHCPACEDRRLVSRRLASIATTALECQVCAGLWIGVESFHDLLALETRGNAGATVSHRQTSVRHPAGKRYRPCPICRELMVPRNIGRGSSGIILDICGEHGLWFDCDELSHTIAWIRSGGLESIKDEVALLTGSPASMRRKALAAKHPRKPTPPLDDSGIPYGPFVSAAGSYQNGPRRNGDMYDDFPALLAYAASEVFWGLFGG